MAQYGIFNGNSRNSEYMRSLQTTRTAKIPYPIERTPREEIEYLQALIADERETIRAFGSSRVTQDAARRIQHYELAIEEWKAAIYAADQELVNDEATAYAIARLFAAEAEYPADLLVARRASFVEQVRGVAR
jgi:hypothetical protein